MTNLQKTSQFIRTNQKWWRGSKRPTRVILPISRLVAFRRCWPSRGKMNLDKNGSAYSFKSRGIDELEDSKDLEFLDLSKTFRYKFGLWQTKKPIYVSIYTRRYTQEKVIFFGKHPVAEEIMLPKNVEKRPRKHFLAYFEHEYISRENRSQKA